MSRAVSSLLLLVLLLGAFGAAVPEREPATRDDVLKHNQEKLEEWKRNPAHQARLQRDLKRFWAMPDEERDRLRQLDRDLHQHPLWEVLERYHAWLERLSEADRRKVEAARGAERLTVIKELREQEYIRRLPPPLRDRVLALNGKPREVELARLREEQRKRMQEPTDTSPRGQVTQFGELPPDAQNAVAKLMRLLSKQEKEMLRRASGRFPDYQRELSRLSRKHRLPLPGFNAPGLKGS